VSVVDEVWVPAGRGELSMIEATTPVLITVGVASVGSLKASTVLPLERNTLTKVVAKKVMTTDSKARHRRSRGLPHRAGIRKRARRETGSRSTGTASNAAGAVPCERMARP
jgi:hypothetical protein